MNDYTEEQLHEYFLQSPPEVQKIILSEDLDTASGVLGKLYKLPIDKFLVLKNIIILLLLGIKKPADIVEEIQKNLSFEKETAISMAKDLDSSILQNVRIKFFEKQESSDEIKTLKIKDSPEKTNEILRNEIMSNIKQETPVNTNPIIIVTSPTREKTPAPLIVGSHDQLIDQLESLEKVPDDEEVAERLSRIKNQVEEMQKNTHTQTEKEEEKIATEYKSLDTTPRKPIFPESYTLDPYRETPVEVV